MAEERSSSYICAEDISVGYHNLPLIQKINLHVNRGKKGDGIWVPGAKRRRKIYYIKEPDRSAETGKRGSVAGWNLYGDHEGKRDCPSYVCDDDRSGENRADDL